MVKKVIVYLCDCHCNAFATEDEARECEEKTSVCIYCGEKVDNASFANGNMIVCDNDECKEKYVDDTKAGLAALFE